MDYLWKIYYQDAKKAENEYARHMTDGASVMLPFEIRPMHGDRSFPLYYRASNEMLLAMEGIYRRDAQLRAMADRLPGIAKEDFLQTLVIDELFTTNEIERVQSTRAEIADSVRHVRAGQGGPRVRFNSMIQSYLRLTDDEVDWPTSLADVRQIYDIITDGEIASDDLPDGRYFRQGAEDVTMSTGKVIHRGVMPESRIEEWMQDLLRFMAEEAVPGLVRVAVAHYVFAYVHPFYDGNGRVGRFLSSLYLSGLCSEYTAYALSQGCRLQQKRYYEMFDRTNKYNSFGEMNYFIEGFLTVLSAGQEKIYQGLVDRVYQLDAAFACIEKDARLDNELKRVILSVLEQKRLFGEAEEGLARRDLARIVADHLHEVKQARLKQCFKELEADGCIMRIKGHPIVYVSALMSEA